ncbi:MAG: double zinc ribbon domain-containing protein [Blastocatellia bacterium]|nr:double zinc ribbon domain-containing protein [Blastocatellia bacterium]
MVGRALTKVRDGLLLLSYPEQCRVCDAMVESWDDGVVCARCWTDPSITETFFSKPLCAKCGVPLLRAPASRALSDERAEQESEGFDCGLCAELPYMHARACGAYGGALEASALFLKSRPYLCRRLRVALAQTFSENRETLASDVIIPVPLHRLRQKERGFNQAAVIAKAISRNFKIPLDTGTLLRTKPTERHRAGMDRIDRTRSVGDAFEVARPRLIAGGRVLLVDDIYTTGSTITACSKALVEAGAEGVNVLTIARAVYISR